MKLKHLYLKESGDVHSFILEEWNGLDSPDLFIQPFSVLVKYHGEAASSSHHPYGEGTAEETHGADVSIVSLTAHEVVHVTSESGHGIETLTDHAEISALIFGDESTLDRVKKILPDASVLQGKNIDKGTKGALEIFSYFEDHSDETIIIDLHAKTDDEKISPMLHDIYCVSILKAILDGSASWKSAGNERALEFTGRIVFIAPPGTPVNDAIENRVATIDLSMDKKYPRGTPLQELPGWSESQIKFFEDKAYENFTGNTP